VDQQVGYFETTVLNQVASNANQESSVVDTRGYKHVWVEFLWSGTGADATGEVVVWGGLTSDPVDDGGGTAALLGTSDLGDTCDNDTESAFAGDYNVDFDNAFSTGSCTLQLENPPPYIAMTWTRFTGGSAAGSTGLTVRVYGTAN
jgi:hypothetical protein